MKLVFLTFTLFLGVCMIQAEGTVPTVNSGTSHDTKSNSELPSAHPAPSSKSDPAQPEKTKEPESNLTTPIPAKSEIPQKTESSPVKPVPAEKLKEPESQPAKPISTTTTTVAPVPSRGSWNVTENNVTCILVEGFITLNARNATDDKTIEAIHILPNTLVEGSCTDRYIQWNITEGALESSLRFTFNATKDEYYLARVDGEVYLPEIHKIGFMNATPQFKTPKNKSYFCGKSIVIDLEKKKGIDFQVELKDFKIEAEKTSKTHGFDEGIDVCPASHHGTPDIIPIIVGCALAILVVVVLVAYLINRRRSQAHGYLSM